MAVALTPSQLKAICPDAPASAVLPLNLILARTGSVTHLRAAMVIAQLAASSRSFRQLEEPEGRGPTPYFSRGWIGITGRRQYREVGTGLGMDLLRHPELVTVHNAEATAWVWNAHHLHRHSDTGDVDGCSRALAGWDLGERRLADARELYRRARGVLSGSRQRVAA